MGRNLRKNIINNTIHEPASNQKISNLHDEHWAYVVIYKF